MESALNVKHYFTVCYPGMMSSEEDTQVLRVFRDGQVSWNGSGKHGRAVYKYHPQTERGQWLVEFHHSGDIAKVKMHVFKQVGDSDVFMLIDKHRAYTAFIIERSTPWLDGLPA